MLEAIRKGDVDCVIVKDLSRFGREYIATGRYIERLFPALGIRFIAINDHYDSILQEERINEIVLPFKNLINDAYCRDISIKIRSHLEIKRKEGQFIGAFPVYGYRRNEKDRHLLEIDPVPAGIVQEIFRMKIRGMGECAIARELNERGIASPMAYKHSVGSRYQTSFKRQETPLWCAVSVRRILCNEIYVGNLVQGRTTTPSHKVKKMVAKPPSEWIRVEKHHTPIISPGMFEAVRQLLLMDTRTAPGAKKLYPLSGFVVCGDCGRPMIRKATCTGKYHYTYYVCRTYIAQKSCHSHRIPAKKLEDTVFASLRKYLYEIKETSSLVLSSEEDSLQELKIRHLQKRCRERKEEADKYRQLRLFLRADRDNGWIGQSEAEELEDIYTQKQNEAEAVLHKTEMILEDLLAEKRELQRHAEPFMQYLKAGQLTREMVVRFISRIRILDKGQIEIGFRYHFSEEKRMITDMVQKEG